MVCQDCAHREEVMEILSSGTAPCNREAQIGHSCKSGAGARQGATTSQAAAWLLLCLPLALQHQVPASAPPQGTAAHLLSNHPQPLAQWSRRQGDAVCICPTLCCPTALLEQGAWALHGALWEGGCRQQTVEAFWKDRSCSSASSFGNILLVCCRWPKDLCPSHGPP